jgi:hypothetical protein
VRCRSPCRPASPAPPATRLAAVQAPVRGACMDVTYLSMIANHACTGVLQVGSGSFWLHSGCDSAKKLHLWGPAVWLGSAPSAPLLQLLLLLLCGRLLLCGGARYDDTLLPRPEQGSQGAPQKVGGRSGQLQRHRTAGLKRQSKSRLQLPRAQRQI